MKPHALNLFNHLTDQNDRADIGIFWKIRTNSISVRTDRRLVVAQALYIKRTDGHERQELVGNAARDASVNDPELTGILIEGKNILRTIMIISLKEAYEKRAVTKFYEMLAGI